MIVNKFRAFHIIKFISVTLVAPLLLHRSQFIKPLIALNIFEAVVQDIVLHKSYNSIVGCTLIGSLFINKEILEVHNLPSSVWVILYMFWNIIFCNDIGICSKSALIHNSIPVYLWICCQEKDCLLIWAISRMIAISVMQLDYLLYQ
jgi:hypothetical protein